jgi:hypothetical protein
MTISATTQGLRPGVCLSTSRPAVPFDGMLIYETDTNKIAVYDGAGWVYKTADVYPKAGSVLQVVSATKTDTFSSATGAANFTNATGLSASITPTSTSSKVIILATVTGSGGVTSNNGFQARITGGNTDSYRGDAAGSRFRVVAQHAKVAGSNNHVETISMNYLDSPATTSATTYQVQVSAIGSGDTVYVNRSATDTDNNTFPRGASTITVMEIAG